MVTWRDVTLSSNEAALSVFDLWFGDAWIEGARVIGNQVAAGSIWNFESFRGRFQQVGVNKLFLSDSRSIPQTETLVWPLASGLLMI